MAKRVQRAARYHQLSRLVFIDSRRKLHSVPLAAAQHTRIWLALHNRPEFAIQGGQ